MNSIYKLIIFLGSVLFISSFIACQKEFLDVQQNKSRVIPNSLEDYQAMLDNTSIMNDLSAHELSQIASDEYLIADERWKLITSPTQKNSYIWANEIYEGADSDDWNNSYLRILYSNTVIEGLNKLGYNDKSKIQWENIMASARFFRALSFYELTQLFSKAYDVNTAKEDLGVPLRIDSDINSSNARASLEETYSFIINELESIKDMLLDSQPVTQRPTKIAAYALLSRIYLQMNNYEKSLVNGEKTLDLGGKLLDYNSLNVKDRYPFPTQGINNPEVLFTTRTKTTTIINTARFNANPDYFERYSSADLRKEIFFHHENDGRITFKGSYFGAFHCFTGLAMDEVYLNIAECYARLENINKAKEAIFVLQKHRFLPNEVPAYESNDFIEIMKVIIEERKKQLYRRGLRWSDLKRFNKEDAFAETLYRIVDGNTYSLSPLDERYLFPISDRVIMLSGIKQNER